MTKPKKVKKKQGDEEVEVEEPTTHNGSLFFPLPNGTALLYRLQGTASAPATEGVIQSKVKAKKSKSIIIPVKNWSRLGQRFLVSWTVQGNQDPGLFIRGANALDIGPNLTKEYKVNFLSLKNGQYKFTVKFLSQ
jgi:hydrocephalus-inducing protein